MDKAALRKELLAKRRGLDPAELERSSRAVQTRLAGVPAWREAKDVLAYMAFGGEVATHGLIEALWARGARVYVPRCRPDEPGHVDLACLTCFDHLQPGRHGILEPDPAKCDLLDACTPDLALIPAVGYDRRGGRLGFGQGYYDRLLARPEFSNTVLVGLAHNFQLVENLPQEPWDRPVHVIVTDKETIWPSP